MPHARLKAIPNTPAEVMLYSHAFLQKGNELLYCKPRLPDKGPERTLRDFTVIGNHQPAVGRKNIPQDHVASASAIQFVAQLVKRRDGFLPGNPGDRAQTATSTISSPIDGGIGSPWARRLSR